MPHFGVVVTTINEGQFAAAYLANFREHSRLKEVRVYVVGDRKTPPSCRAACDAARVEGLDCVYLGIEEQNAFLGDYAELAVHIPWNSDNRRNVGFLMALRDGVEVLISIDDDNLPVPGSDFLAGHAIVGTAIEAPAVSASGHWHNLFDALEYTPNVTVWPRGFPYRKRNATATTFNIEKTVVHVNAGLWLGDPDVDAITRIAVHPTVKSMRMPRGLLARETFSPINTQNTAVHRASIPAYYYLLMHEPMHGSRLNRFGDIWSGYFIQKCAKVLGAAVAFGAPLVEQVRNDHDLFVDLREEYWGIVLSEHLSAWIVDVTLKGDTYASVYGDLADQLQDHVGHLDLPVVNSDVIAYFDKVNKAMHAWLSAVERASR